MKPLPVVEVRWGDAWVDTSDYSLEEAKKFSPIIRKTIGYLVHVTDEHLILATDLYEESKTPEISKNTINTPMVIPLGMVIEWYEIDF
jgi:hypothetical protein